MGKRRNHSGNEKIFWTKQYWKHTIWKLEDAMKALFQGKCVALSVDTAKEGQKSIVRASIWK